MATATQAGDKLKRDYDQARADRKKLESELQEIDTQIAAAMVKADADEMIKLRERKAALPAEYIKTSATERRAAQEFFDARFQAAQASLRDADTAWAAADMELFNLRQRHAEELKAAEAKLREAEIDLNTAKVGVTQAGSQLADSQAGYQRPLKEWARLVG